MTNISADRSDIARRAASGTFWITIDMVTVQATSLLVFMVIAHYVTPRDFGLIAIAFAFIYSLKNLAVDNVSVPIMRKALASDLEFTTVFWLSLIFGSAAMLLLCLFSLLADRIFHAPGLGQVIRPMSLILIALAFGRAQESWLIRHFRFRTLAIRAIIGAFLGAIAGMTAAVSGLGVWALVVQQCAASFSSVAMLWWTTPWRPTFQFSRRASTEILQFQQKISSTTLLNLINQNADTALVALFFGPVAVGIYSVGKRLKTALLLVASNPIRAMSIPSLADNQADPEHLATTFLGMSRVMITLCAPIFIGASAAAAPAVAVLFGIKWMASAPIFAWLAVGALFTIICDYSSDLLVLQDRTKLLFLLASLQTALSVILFIIIQATGQHIIAAPFVIPYVIVLPLSVKISLRSLKIPVRVYLSTTAPPLLASAIMLLCVRAAHEVLHGMRAVTLLGVEMIVGAFIFWLVMLIVAPKAIPAMVQAIRYRGR